MNMLEELTSIVSQPPESARPALLDQSRELEGSARADALERLQQTLVHRTWTVAGLEKLPCNRVTYLAVVLIDMARRYDMSHPETVETVVAGLLADRQRAVCLCYGELCCVLEGVKRQQVLDTFLAVWRETESVQLHGPHIYVVRDEIDAVCRAAGWEIPPMFPIRFGDESRNRPLDAATRTRILQATGLEAGTDVAEQLLMDIEKAVNRYRREPVFKEGLPTKPEARGEAISLMRDCEALRKTLSDLHPALRTHFRWLLEQEWNIDLDTFEGMLQQFGNGALELKVRIEERMRAASAGRPVDEAAQVLACEIAYAMHKAGLKSTAYREGPFERDILPAALATAQAGTADSRVHQLAMQAVEALAKRLRKTDPEDVDG